MDLTEFDIDFLSQKLSENPSSPLFARLADLYLSKNQEAEAVKICEDGVKIYPEYISGHIILGRGYSALKMFSKARKSFQKALDLSPFNEAAEKFIEEVPLTEEDEQQTSDSEFVPAAQPETPSLPEIPSLELSPEVTTIESPTAVPGEFDDILNLPKETYGDLTIPEPQLPEIPESVISEPALPLEIPGLESAPQFQSLDEYLQLHAVELDESRMITLDQFLGVRKAAPAAKPAPPPPPPPEPEPSDLDALASQLSSAKKIVPRDVDVTEPPAIPSGEPSPFESNMITPTLAEIYASQGEYSAAIQAYEILMLSKADEAPKYEKRIKELQAKLNETGGLF